MSWSCSGPGSKILVEIEAKIWTHYQAQIRARLDGRIVEIPAGCDTRLRGTRGSGALTLRSDTGTYAKEASCILSNLRTETETEKSSLFSHW